VHVTSTRYGATSFATRRGIFGLPASTFQIQLGSDANIFMVSLTVVANKTIEGLVWLASYAYSLIERAPVFDFVTNLVRPQNGISKVVPVEYFGYTFDLSSINREFTIEYASPTGNSRVLYYMILFGIGISVMTYVIRKVF